MFGRRDVLWINSQAKKFWLENFVLWKCLNDNGTVIGCSLPKVLIYKYNIVERVAVIFNLLKNTKMPSLLWRNPNSNYEIF